MKLEKFTKYPVRQIVKYKLNEKKRNYKILVGNVHLAKIAKVFGQLVIILYISKPRYLTEPPLALIIRLKLLFML